MTNWPLVVLLPGHCDGVLFVELFGKPLWPDMFLAMAAFLTAAAGFLSAWAALRRTRQTTKKTAEEECLERVRAAYAETEAMAQELHQLRMKR